MSGVNKANHVVAQATEALAALGKAIELLGDKAPGSVPRSVWEAGASLSEAVNRFCLASLTVVDGQ